MTKSSYIFRPQAKTSGHTEPEIQSETVRGYTLLHDY